MRRVFRDIHVILVGAWTILATVVRRLVRGPKHPSWTLRFEIVAEIMRMALRLGHDTMSVEMQRLQPTPPLTRGIRRRLEWKREPIADLPTELHTPNDWETGAPTLVHFHGGGYTMCSPATHRLLLARIALASNARCIAPDYRKAPEHPYPAAIEDCLGVYQAVLDDGVDPQTIVISGDSAGGGLALAVLQRIRDGGLPMPRAAVLLSPWCNLSVTSGGSIDDNASLDYLAGDMLDWAAGVYLDGLDAKHPEASAVFADLSGLPPLLVQSGGGEILLDQNHTLVERAREAGVEVVHEITDGMIHVFQILDPFPTARRATESIARYIRAAVAGPPPAE